jgi:ABC-type lipoprotein release transport system permease subunit
VAKVSSLEGDEGMTVGIKLIPTASRCIETTAKREYWKSVDAYLKKGIDDKDLEERIELLRVFLETADFGMLRRQSEEHIVVGKRVAFTLFMRNGEPVYEMTVDHASEK